MARLSRTVRYVLEDGKFKAGRIIEAFDDDEPNEIFTTDYDTFMDALSSDSMLLARSDV